MNRWKPILTLLIALAIVLLITSAAQACPMCKDSIATAKNDLPGGGSHSSHWGGGSVGGGFNNSIYIMLAGFLSTVGLVAYNLVRAIRR